MKCGGEGGGGRSTHGSWTLAERRSGRRRWTGRLRVTKDVYYQLSTDLQAMPPGKPIMVLVPVVYHSPGMESWYDAPPWLFPWNRRRSPKIKA